eukprot:gb/GEZN01007714.1/.p1 GENE.gb/GEZN01007714.1/~~gb/GEZN01007714.1/.p1  ORF type:complete len:358 (+),score=34.32 gb/GEZN01007714.1/:312-1385(+)
MSLVSAASSSNGYSGAQSQSDRTARLYELNYPIWEMRVHGYIMGKGDRYVRVLSMVAANTLENLRSFYRAEEEDEESEPTKTPSLATPAKPKDKIEFKFKTIKEESGTATVERDLNYDGVASGIYAIVVALLPDSGMMKLFSAGIPAGDGPSALKLLSQKSETKLGKRDLLRRLMNMRMQNCSNSLDGFVYELSHLVATLATVHGFPRDDDLILSLFITGLDTRFATLATVLSANETITSDNAVKLVKDFSTNDPHFTLLKTNTNTTNNSDTTTKQSYLASVSDQSNQCYNCRGNHHERKCTEPCKIGQAKTHTRYGCPKKASKVNGDASKKETSKVMRAMKPADHKPFIIDFGGEM